MASGLGHDSNVQHHLLRGMAVTCSDYRSVSCSAYHFHLLNSDDAPRHASGWTSRRTSPKPNSERAFAVQHAIGLSDWGVRSKCARP